MDCVKCSRKNTKYKCISCGASICQVCSLQATKDNAGYSEENKTLGFCSVSCVPQGSGNKRSSNQSSFEKKSSTRTYGKQTSLSSYFTLPKKKQKVGESENEKKSSDTEEQRRESKGKQVKRMVSVETVEKKWKQETLAEYDADYDIENKNAINLRCKVCKKYESDITGMKFFRKDGMIGSCNYRTSNAIDHAKSEPHKYAMRKYMREEEGKTVVEKRQAGQKDLIAGINNMTEKENSSIQKKFEAAYIVAKQELPLRSYEAILELENLQGVELGNPYRHRNAFSLFIDYIGYGLAEDLRDKLENVNFFSVLWDGSTDVSVKKKETTFVTYLDKDSCPDKVQLKMSFLGIRELEHSHAGGVRDTIIDGFNKLGELLLFFRTFFNCSYRYIHCKLNLLCVIVTHEHSF